MDRGTAVAAADLTAVVAHAPVADSGTVVGPYKLLQQIGTGGMAVVFLAEQTSTRIARDQYQKAGALLARHCGPDHPDTLRSMINQTDETPAGKAKANEQVDLAMARLMQLSPRATRTPTR